jgi:hypothetical protein
VEAGFDLAGLGWLQFQWLCQWALRLLSGAEDLSWRGSADQLRIGASAEALDGQWFGAAKIEAPALVGVCWLAGDDPEKHERRALSAAKRLVREHDTGGGKGSLLMMNVPAPAQLSQLGIDAVVDGPRLTAAVLEHESLRLRVPSVLGLRHLPAVTAAEAESSTLDLEAALELSRVFVSTRAHHLTVDVLDRHHFAVLTGPPEMGKTAIARTIGLALLSAGWQAHECLSPDDLWTAYRESERQVFIADDAFGSTEYRPDAAERWARELPRILKATDERHWLIWTSRPAPLRAGLHRVHQERGSERFPSPAQVQVDAAALDIDEKACILLRHAQAAELSENIKHALRTTAVDLVRHPHFTPERIRRFVTDRLPKEGSAGFFMMRSAVEREMQEPTQAMSASLEALSPEHRALLVAMLDCPEGPVHDRDLVRSMRRHHPQGITHLPAELIERLSDHFLRVTGVRVTWIHPSWRDLVIDRLAAEGEARQTFLLRAELPGIMLALSTDGGPTGDRRLPLLVTDGDWDALGDSSHRLARTVSERDLVRLLVTVEAAAKLELGPQAEPELRAVIDLIAATLHRRFAHEPELMTARSLGAWFIFARLASEPPPAPDLRAAWARLRPTPTIDPRNPGDLRQVDDWLALAEVIKQHDQQVLKRLGFADDLDVLRRALYFAKTSSMIRSTLLLSILSRLKELDRGLWMETQDAAANVYAPVSEVPTLPTHRPGETQGEDERIKQILADL